MLSYKRSSSTSRVAEQPLGFHVFDVTRLAESDIHFPNDVQQDARLVVSKISISSQEAPHLQSSEPCKQMCFKSNEHEQEKKLLCIKDSLTY